MMRVLLALLIGLLALPASAAPSIRAVFVGIDTYQYSRQRLASSRFDDLSGAVGDVGRIKAALGSALGLDFGPMPAGTGCQTATSMAITLTDRCATRAAILDSWARVIGASRPQDIVILYFAGHGSRFIDRATMDQASRYNSTLMPYDARNPSALSEADIVDHEVRDRINRATSRGVRVVTIFDSCNSGTANRNGNSASRTAPDLPVANLRRLASPAQYGNLGAWRVHLAAAGDGQDAQEVDGGVGVRAGVFTTALARALTSMKGASFADMAARTVVEVSAATRGRQVPHAEGALRASFAGEEIRVPTFQVTVDRDRLVMLGGRLLGVTPGSRFDLFATTSDALAGNSTAPLATARVASTGNSVAVLQLDAPATTLPPRMVARERDHEFGGAVLALAVEDAAAAPAVKALRFVRSDPNAELALAANEGGMALYRRGGPVLARLPLPADQRFGPMLAAALGKIARVDQWLATLRRQPPDLCLAVSNAPSNGYDPASCPAGPPPANVTLKQAQSIRLGLVNRAGAARQLYVFHIGPRYDVTVVLPAFGGRDPSLQPGDALRDGVDIFPTEAGDVRMVALSSSVALDVSVLEQTATDVIDTEACLSAVARIFCSRADTARSGTAGEARAWSALIIPARVTP